MTKLQIKKLANSIIKSDKWNIQLTTLKNIRAVEKKFYSKAFRVYFGDVYLARTYWLNGTIKDEKNIKRQLLISLQYMGMLHINCKLNKKG